MMFCQNTLNKTAPRSELAKLAVAVGALVGFQLVVMPTVHGQTNAQATTPTTSATAASGSSAVSSADQLMGFMRERGILAPLQAGAAELSDLASRLVVHAMGFVGVPYKLGGNHAETGLDCSGFVRAVYSEMTGRLLPRKAEEQAAATALIDRADLQPGDLVFFNTLRRAYSHVGIYVGEGRFVHSPRPGGEVRVESMSKTYWTSRFDGARRAISNPTPEQSTLRQP
jgi:cell wall-associated NlpC family hydrolase